MPEYKSKKQILSEAGYTPSKGAPQRFDAQLAPIRISQDLKTAIEVDAIKKGITVQEWRRKAYEKLLLIHSMTEETKENAI